MCFNPPHRSTTKLDLTQGIDPPTNRYPFIITTWRGTQAKHHKKQTQRTRSLPRISNNELYPHGAHRTLLPQCDHGRTWLVHTAANKSGTEIVIFLEHVPLRDETICWGDGTRSAGTGVLSAGAAWKKIVPLERQQAMGVAAGYTEPSDELASR